VSAGPIKRERDAWKPITVSTPDAHRVCMGVKERNRGYCGREAKGSKVTTEWADVVCSDCVAAYRADEAARKERR
jgi:hypothetical protein